MAYETINPANGEKIRTFDRLSDAGTKLSGYGRELSVQGIREIVNLKTVYVK